jgi:hypothetical protein
LPAPLTGPVQSPRAGGIGNAQSSRVRPRTSVFAECLGVRAGARGRGSEGLAGRCRPRRRAGGWRRPRS